MSERERDSAADQMARLRERAEVAEQRAEAAEAKLAEARAENESLSKRLRDELRLHDDLRTKATLALARLSGRVEELERDRDSLRQDRDAFSENLGLAQSRIVDLERQVRMWERAEVAEQRAEAAEAEVARLIASNSAASASSTSQPRPISVARLDLAEQKARVAFAALRGEEPKEKP